MRVLLVHANPFQRVVPVPAYGLERLRTACADVAEIELLDPYLVSDRPLEAAAEAAQRLRPDVVGLGIRVVDDCIVVDEDAPGDGPFDVTWFMPEIRRLRDALARAAPDALLVAGGAAFSAMPEECLAYLDLEHGVVGAGEAAFRDLLVRVGEGRPLDGVRGLHVRGRPSPLAHYAVDFGAPTQRDPLYAPANSLPVRTRIGCAMQCAYCLTANLLRRHDVADVDAVVEEIARTVAEAAERGLPLVPIFFADDELNLPDERHPLAVLRALRERGLEGSVKWRGYFNPTPFSDELAAAVAATNGHASITVDTAAEAVMARSGKPFRRRHLEQLVELLGRHAVPADMGLIFGLPGETEDTVRETVAFVRTLPPTIEVVYSVGARVYPHTPLAAIAAAEPHYVVGADDPTFFEPVVYSSPLPPRELRTLLAAELDGLPNVRPVGVGFGSGRTTLAAAYRAARTPGSTGWRDVLDAAERPGDYQRTPPEALGAVLQVALWHGRFDLAAATCRRMLRREILPEGLAKRQVRAAWAVYRATALFRR